MGDNPAENPIENVLGLLPRAKSGQDKDPYLDCQYIGLSGKSQVGKHSVEMFGKHLVCSVNGECLLQSGLLLASVGTPSPLAAD